MKILEKIITLLNWVLALLAISLILYVIYFIFEDSQKPVNYETLRVQECEVKLGGTVHEKPCNQYFYSLTEDRD